MHHRALRTCLRCLSHPATVFSIVVLVLNDHLFKALVPSWITGKLSDLAGLFFFPFLLATALSMFWAFFPLFSSITVGRVAFAVTALWFAAAKGTPWGHATTVRLVSGVLGHPVAIVRDPTDLLALAMLWPAWRLWCREVERPPRERARYLGWAVLALGTLATVATTPQSIDYVRRIVVVEGGMYALVEQEPTAAGSEWTAYRTLDNGTSWSPLERVPDPVRAELVREVQSPIGAPHDSRTQYRLGKETVEVSSDGGQTWRVDWQIPPGRRKFMLRYPRGPNRPLTIGPYDLAFTPDGSGTLVVALGTEGVLVRDPSGAWSRHGVGRLVPTPYATRDPDKMMSVLTIETVVLLACAFALFVLLSIWGWIPILIVVWQVRGSQEVAWIMRPGLALLGGIAVVLVVFGLMSAGLASALDIDRSLGRGFFSLILVLPALMQVVVLVIWSRTVRLANDARWARRARWACVGTTLIASLAPVVPLVLWALGAIPEHNQAVTGALILGFVIVMIGAIVIFVHSCRAVQGPVRQG